MAATTPATVLFGAPGVSDPQMFHPGLVCLKRTIDFSKSPVDISEDGADQALFGVPKSFVAIGAFFESDKDRNGAYPSASGTVTLKVADTTAGDDVTIGATYTPSNSAYKRQTAITGYTGTVASTTATITGGPAAFDSVDATTGKLLAFVTLGADQVAGVVTVGLLGFVPDGDSLGNVVTPDPRVAPQATVAEKDNVAKLDPYNG